MSEELRMMFLRPSRRTWQCTRLIMTRPCRWQMSASVAAPIISAGPRRIAIQITRRPRQHRSKMYRCCPVLAQETRYLHRGRLA